jgi:AcrR family transcriptional regulator
MRASVRRLESAGSDDWPAGIGRLRESIAIIQTALSGMFGGMAVRTAKRPSPRERLLAASDELFYRNGVHSTGIDAVIEKAGVAKGSLYYIFGGKDELVAAYLRGRHEAWQQRVEAVQASTDDPDAKILAIFDAVADYVSLPEFRGCPFHNAAAEAPEGEAQQLAIKEYRDWLRHSFAELAAGAGVTDSEALADGLIVLYDGALATAEKGGAARARALTAKRIARLTLAAAKVAG